MATGQDEAAFETYVCRVRQTPLDQHTEMTGRSALEALLNHFSPPKATVTHEPKRAQEKGAPDFKIAMAGQIVGYLENKQVGENLDAVLRSDQLARYRKLSGNIVVTDYLRWIWERDGKVIADVRLGEAGLLVDRKPHLRPDRMAEVAALLRNFSSRPAQGISRAKTLAEALAVRSHLLRDYLGDELVRQNQGKASGQLIGLYHAFQKHVSQEITLAEFADAFAQTLAYGLFLAKLNDPQGAPITLTNAKTFIPQSFGLIRELVSFLDNLEQPEYADVRWVIEEVLSIINGLDLATVQEDLSFRNRRGPRGTRAANEEEWRLFSRDPYIYFYEDFLGKYDSKMRKQRGVYYTPPPVVNFIVRAVHHVLKSAFNISSGLADRKRVTVLDFACGTGTFLVEVLQQIFEELGPNSGKAGKIVEEHILRNIFGFEYLIAPYTIAHLKVGQYLAEKGYPVSPAQRLQIILTNTVENLSPQENYLLPELSKEMRAAHEIKQKNIMVILGNPPYAGHSRNNGPTARASINRYKRVFEYIGNVERELPLGEKNPKWLQDDYVKFIANAEIKMEDSDVGIVALITNHSFLDNPTFRGMRQSLMKTFQQLWFIDLHGNYEKREKSPDGNLDENIFDIKQGVAISLMVKCSGLERRVFRADLWGTRQVKYQELSKRAMDDLAWEEIHPALPHFSFVAENREARNAYAVHRSIGEIFRMSSVGIVSARDNLCIQFDADSSLETARRFIQYPPEMARSEFGLGPDTHDWRIKWAQADLSEHGSLPDSVRPILYRPFDVRSTIYTGTSRGFLCRPRDEVMQHFLEDNVGLIAPRVTKDQFDVLVTSGLAAHKSGTRYDISYVMPLYLYLPPDPKRRARMMEDLVHQAESSIGQRRIENIRPEFRRWIDSFYGHAWSADQIFGLVYSILHSPTYRTKYSGFLRTDFPRIPFPKGREEFERLSALGWELVEAHLLKTSPQRNLGAYRGFGSDEVAKPRYDETKRELWINAHKRFVNVPESVWSYTIGGYQVLDKYLKSRKGRTLSLDEQEHIEKVINVLDFTAEQMNKIDEVYLAAGL